MQIRPSKLGTHGFGSPAVSFHKTNKQTFYRQDEFIDARLRR
jgi:hypothetical protein